MDCCKNPFTEKLVKQILEQLKTTQSFVSTFLKHEQGKFPTTDVNKVNIQNYETLNSAPSTQGTQTTNLKTPKETSIQ